MKLQYVSFTGADNHVSIETLNQLSARHPYIEFPLLYMPEKAGLNRYPDHKWITEFLDQYSGENLAIHLCSTALFRFTEKDASLSDLLARFNRIQLNLRFAGCWDAINREGLVQAIKTMPEKEFIIQYGQEQDVLLPELETMPGIALLIDGSAGEGILPDNWLSPVQGFKCGYAGGLSPDNIKTQVEMINSITPPDYLTWIDMETGVRTNDHFDLNKVGNVLQAISSYLEN